MMGQVLCKYPKPNPVAGRKKLNSVCLFWNEEGCFADVILKSLKDGHRRICVVYRQ
jgi:hypothetical protein